MSYQCLTLVSSNPWANGNGIGERFRRSANIFPQHPPHLTVLQTMEVHPKYNYGLKLGKNGFLSGP